MAEPGDPHSPHDGAPQGPNDDDLFRDAGPTPPPQSQRPTWAAPIRPAPGLTDPYAEVDLHAHDDLIGFTSPASLAGTGRRPTVIAEPAPDPVEPEPVIAPFPQLDPVIHAPELTTPRRDEPAVDQPFFKPAPVPVWKPAASQSDRPVRSLTRSRSGFGRADAAMTDESQPQGATGLYTIYALILFAVPTFGVAAMIGLFMVWTKAKPDQPLARSHFEFQTRTLWIAAIAAVVGVVLIAVNLGVFVLFLMALWVIVRGAWGVMTLAAGEPVRNPRTWLI